MSSKVSKANKKQEAERIQKEEKRRRTKRIKTLLLLVSGILFVSSLLLILTTNIKFDRIIKQAVEGQDYVIEPVTVTGKDYNASLNANNLGFDYNYWFYYNDGDEKLFVDEDTYDTYQVGDQMLAYTVDHAYYCMDESVLLPRDDYKANELRKARCVLYAVVLLFTLGWIFFDRWLERRMGK